MGTLLEVIFHPVTQLVLSIFALGRIFFAQYPCKHKAFRHINSSSQDQAWSTPITMTMMASSQDQISLQPVNFKTRLHYTRSTPRPCGQRMHNNTSKHLQKRNPCQNHGNKQYKLQQHGIVITPHLLITVSHFQPVQFPQ